MRNPAAALRPHLRRYSSTLLLLFYLLSSSSTSIHSLHVSSREEGQRQWQILTKLNFSSQIRLNPHVLLIVTVPWSGESRSLMKELSHAVTEKEEFDTLKLMLVFRNRDRMLADALGATTGVNIIYYHHSLSYKYQGTVRVQSILSSVRYVKSLLPEEIPLKSLTTAEELTTFLDSTDKALLLLEFCGWTPKLMAKVMNNGSKNAFGAPFETCLNRETNETSSTEGKKNQKGIENEKIGCRVDNQFSRISGLAELFPLNESDFLEADNMRFSDGHSCSFEEFQQFELSLSNFTNVVREFFLPPERLKFGLMSDRSLASSLGVGDTSSWLMMLYFAGCPSCAKVLKGGSDLKKVLGIHAAPVRELTLDEYGLDPGLPSNRPSIILFVDRSSDSLNTRRKSKEALNVFRELASHNYNTYKIITQNNAKPQKPSTEAQSLETLSGHPKLELSTLSQKVTMLKDKISITVMNEGKHVTIDRVASDLQGSSLQEILQYVLQQKKETKLSSLAKDVGFQLLSDDIDIKMPDREIQSKQQSVEPSIKGLVESDADFEKDHVLHEDDILNEYETVSKPRADHSALDDQKTDYTSAHLSVKAKDVYQDDLVFSTADEKVEEGTISELENRFKQLYLANFNCSFFFSDGQFRLLEELTGVSKIPSLVIIDPVSRQHYVLAEEEDFSYSSLSGFVHIFLNGSLQQYQRSESVILDSREHPHPPFVNRDIHEVDSIPRVRVHTFMELVIGNHSDSLHAGNAWKKDVLVLFTSSSCGFCQRIELVIREVYHTFKGYGNIMKSQHRDKKSSRSDGINNTMFKLPVIYTMDCIRNDCSSILKTMTKRELYPFLLLFPAESKEAVSYEGDISVINIIRFIADQGGVSHWLYKERGILWDENRQGARNEDDSLTKESHEILLKHTAQTQKVELENYKTIGQEVQPGSILFATEKLKNVYPFQKSKILIVKVNQSSGFQGLIINKRISWDAIKELEEEGFEFLRKTPLSYGGPVMARGLPLVSLTRKPLENQHPQVLPDVYFVDQWSTIKAIQDLKLQNKSIMIDYWFFVGYSSWGWNQLFDEIADGAWNVTDGTVVQLDWSMT